MPYGKASKTRNSRASFEIGTDPGLRSPFFSKYSSQVHSSEQASLLKRLKIDMGLNADATIQYALVPEGRLTRTSPEVGN